MGRGRAALLLGVLIAGTFIAGVTTAVIRVTGDDEPQALPTESPSPTAEPTESPSPTAEPTEEPSPEPTEEQSPEPTEEPSAESTEEPSAEPSPEPPDGDVGGLAETGAESTPFLLGGALMIGLAGALWRLSRPPAD